MKASSLALLALVLFTAPVFAAVKVSIPYNKETVGPSIQVVASANTACSKGVASMGVYINNKLIYVAYTTNMNHWLPVGPGWNHVVVEEWDYCGGSSYTAIDVNAQGRDGVSVTSPKPNSSVGSQVSYVASASSSCAKGVAAMGVYVANKLVYVAQGHQLNHTISLGGGKQHTVVQEWDRCGGSKYQTVDLTVSGPATSPGTTLSSLQTRGNWRSWGELPPYYAICEKACSGIGFLLHHDIKSPSHSGHAAQFSTWGSHPYADVLWSLPLIGQNSDKPDRGHDLLPKYHYFNYDADVYVTKLAVTQTLEFDINMYLNTDGMIWGTQCEHLGRGTWDIWDNQAAKWISTGAPCKLHQGWNHVTLHMQRNGQNKLLYQSITLNGETYQIDKWYPPFRVPASWYGMSINYQMDGDKKQSSNTTFVDNLSLNYR